MSRRVAVLIVFAVVGVAALWTLRYSLAARVGVVVRTSEFKDNFDPRNAYATDIHPVDWAVLFNGRFGLSAVRRLALDESITGSGRRTAAKVVLVIEGGKHVPVLDLILGDEEWDDLPFDRRVHWVVRDRDRSR